jgi:hypothetical protein
MLAINARTRTVSGFQDAASIANPPDKSARHLRLISENTMTKKYIVVRDRIPSAIGGFIEAFRMALVELANMGERHFDLTGYPHDTEADALLSDWAALGADFNDAASKFDAPRTGRELIDEQQGR